HRGRPAARRLGGVSAAIGLAFGAGSSFAQQAAPSLPPVQVEAGAQAALSLAEPTQTGSRLGLTPLETPASIEVLTGETIRARGDVSVIEAATRATGITGSPAPGNGSTSMAARGFSGHGSVMQLFDGTRLFAGAGTVTFPFDTWSVDRIEVLRGAASVMYGEGAIGGAINVVPKKPTRGPVRNEAL
ncbi:MAG: TonB-dependent receptor plug domain-containing protein, partial [Brevundimonas aurantiaca]